MKTHFTYFMYSIRNTPKKMYTATTTIDKMGKDA